MGFLKLFNWFELSTPRLIFNIVTLVLLTGWTLYLLHLDRKYKEVTTWKIYLGSLMNYLFLIIGFWVFKISTIQIRIYLSLVPILFLGLDFLNAKFNKETKIGQADVTSFLQQLFLSIISGMAISQLGFGGVQMIAFWYMVQLQFGMIFVGLVYTLVIAILRTIITMVTKKVTLRVAFDMEKEVPSMKVFLPLMLLNFYILLGM